MKYLKKGLVLLITLSLALSLFGCGGQAGDTQGTGAEKSGSAGTGSAQAASDTGTEQARQPINVTWFGNVAGSTYPFTEGILHNPVFDEIYKRTGCIWDFTPCMGTTDYTQKLGVLLAGGDIPDVLEAADGQALLKIIKAGVVRDDLEDLVKKYGPNIMEYTKKSLAVNKLQRSNGTGKLYGFANDVQNGPNWDMLRPSGLYVRWDLYKKLGTPKLQTTDDYLNLVADMLKLEPQNKDGKKNYGFGFNLKWQGSHMSLGDYPFEQFAGIYFATWENNVDLRNDKQFIPRISPDSVFVKEMRFWNKAWRMGLVDPESITMDGAAATQKEKDGRYLAGSGFGVGNDTDASFAAQGTPEKGMGLVIVEDLVSKDALDMADLLTAGNAKTFVVTNACKNPERVVQMIDFLCSPEGVVLQQYGIEGQHWEIENGKGVIKEEVVEGFKNDPDYAKKTGLQAGFGYWTLNFLQPTGLKIKDGIDADFGHDPENLAKSLNQVQKDYCQYYGVKVPAEIYSKRAPVVAWDPWACNIMTLPEDLAPKEAKISSYLDATVPRVVFSKTEEAFNSELKKMLDELKAMGWDECSDHHARDYAEVQVKFDKMMEELENK